MRFLKTLLAGALSLVLAVPAYGAGTIFGLPLSQQIDSSGDPLVGAKLFLYEADTTTPVTVYEDFGLSTATSNPLETDGSGRIPEFWLADGSYRARLTTAGGVVVFDILNTSAIGASSGGGGSGSTVSQNSIFTTGMVTWMPVDSTKTGWVRANGRTIGSAASGATERANADTQPLYEWLWANCTDTNCPVTGGRGASASADFAANKIMAAPDWRGRGLIGLDTMGNSAASVVAGATAPGTVAGAESSTALIEHDHGVGTYAVGSHDHGAGTYSAANHDHGSGSLDTDSPGNHSHTTGINANGANWQSLGGSGDPSKASGSGDNTSSDGNHSHSISGSTANSGSLNVTGTSGATTPTFTGDSAKAGSGTSYSLMNPHVPGSWYLRL